jgi:thymidine kinase
MSGYETHYDIQLLDDLHNYFPDILYAPQRFTSVVDLLAYIREQVESGLYQVVIIDEGQFYGDLYAFVTKWADRLSVEIVVAGLDGDSNRAPFGDMLRLIPQAEELVRLSAFCSQCKNGTEAHFTKSLIRKEEQVAIGGANIYLPVCRKHFLEQ